MKALEYPFNPQELLGKKKKIKRELLASKTDFVEKKIAILGGSTTSEIKNILELFLLHNGIKPNFYESAYNKFYEEAIFDNPALEQFAPDIIYIHTTNRNLSAYPNMEDNAETIDAMLEAEYEKYESVWEQLTGRYRCPLIQNNFEMPLFRLLGNKDASDIHGAVNYLTRLNLKFYEYAQTHGNFFICDINYLSADFGLKEWSDPFYWYMYKYALNVNAIPYLSFNVANIIKSIFGKNKKGLVLDLDNTLWVGVVGEDGVANIKIGVEGPEGQAYTAFQKYIKAQKQIGVLLAVDSKNDRANAIAGLEHSDGVLRPDDFVEIRANWQPKDRNFEEIAEALHLLPESLVFVDDNPAERHIVTEQLPNVVAPEIGESHQYIQNIDRSGFFEVTYLSDDDFTRTKMMQENVKRESFQKRFSDYGEYLQSLDMRATIRQFEPMYLERISQLTNKSNQFNLTTRRYTRAEIEAIAEDRNYITLYGRLKDRFGDNGVVSVVIGRKEHTACHIDLWLMSCRVLGRGMEYAMLNALVRQCREQEITKLHGYYYPTKKNGMVKELYGAFGFEKVRVTEDFTEWELDISGGYENKNKYIKVEGA